MIKEGECCALPWQLLLLVVAWIHGCIGLRSWLRTKRWYHHTIGVLSSLATLVPVLAILGVVNVGLNLRDAVLREPQYAATFVPSPNSRDEQEAASAVRISQGVTIFYLTLVIGTFGLRAARAWQVKRFHGIRITYPEGYVVSVPTGVLGFGGKSLGRPSTCVCLWRPRPLLHLPGTGAR